jgi:hypothetical protein
MEGQGNRGGGGAGALRLDRAEGAALHEPRIGGMGWRSRVGPTVWRTGGRCGSGGWRRRRGRELGDDVETSGVAAFFSTRTTSLRLSALIILYIHHLKGIFRPSHHKIYSFPASIHPLYHPLFAVGLTCHFI